MKFREGYVKPTKKHEIHYHTNQRGSGLIGLTALAEVGNIVE